MLVDQVRVREPDGFVVGPVSYTHLDVYKRQVQLCATASDHLGLEQTFRVVCNLSLIHI